MGANDITYIQKQLGGYPNSVQGPPFTYFHFFVKYVEFVFVGLFFKPAAAKGP